MKIDNIIARPKCYLFAAQRMSTIYVTIYKHNTFKWQINYKNVTREITKELERKKNLDNSCVRSNYTRTKKIELNRTEHTTYQNLWVKKWWWYNLIFIYKRMNFDPFLHHTQKLAQNK